jgi:uncharacterized membrane protein required for colicin V production
MQETITLNPLDIIIAAAILYGMFRGAKQGIIKNGGMLLAIGLGVIGGVRFRGMAQTLYLDYLGLQLAGEVVMILSFATAFIIVYILANTAVNFLSQGLDKMKFKLDSALGALMGGVFSTLLLSVVFLVSANFNFPSAQNAQGSFLYPHVRNFARYTLGLSAEILKEANIQLNRPLPGSEPQPAPPAGSGNNSRPPVIR